MKIFLKLRKKTSNTKKGFTPTPINIGVSSQRERGFTLVELLVVFFIMASILAVIVPGYFEYSTKLDLDNLALDVALTIREAQGYVMGAKETIGENFSVPYGVHFTLNDPSHFIFFADKDFNDVYTGSSESVNVYTMKNGYTIDNLCATRGGSENCIAGGVNYLDIIFKRPNPDAIITIRNSVGNPIGGAGYQDSAKIELISPDQTTTSVKINLLGAISIPDN